MFERHEPSSPGLVGKLQHYLEDIIYGANDGLVTTFTIISGVQGAKLSPVVLIILGFVNLFADGFSMGASRYLSIRAGAHANGKSRGILEPFYHGFCTFAAFLFLGFLPLISFLIPSVQSHQFLISSVITAFALFGVGCLRIFIRQKNWLWGGIEMLLIGGLAALVAYGVGDGINKLIS